MLRAAVAIAAFFVLASCASRTAKPAMSAPPATRARAPATTAPTHDSWRALIAAPFGSTLSQIPFPLHEVILFQGNGEQGDGNSKNPGEEQECYAKSGAPYVFAGAAVEAYVLCFRHERLFRVEAALRLPGPQTPDVFARWCEDWLQGTAIIERAPGVCEGREGGTGFEARLNERDEAGESITLVVFDGGVR